VEPRSDGTRHLYALRLRGFSSVRDFLDEFWDSALARLEQVARRR
jgi:hypothetical protein